MWLGQEHRPGEQGQGQKKSLSWGAGFSLDWEVARGPSSRGSVLRIDLPHTPVAPFPPVSPSHWVPPSA